MDLRQITRLYHTVKHLKLTQVYHQIKYRLVPAKRPIKSTSGTFVLHQLASSPAKAQALEVREGRWQFRFLNLEKTWDSDKVDWSHAEYGMLWTYNLNYFDWLHQENMKPEVGLKSLSAFYGVVDQNPNALHPYPTSLRIINAAKFVCKWGVQETWLHVQIVADLHLLKNRLEYHLLANHLLENAFALYIGGIVTGERNFLDAGRKLLEQQLQEQILDDGMHYERSPMYHMIILERLLDALNFAKAIDDVLVELLTTHARKMTSLAMNWNGLERIPMMQDSAYGVALSVSILLKYSKRLLESRYPTKAAKFKSSGYRISRSKTLFCFINAGSIKPNFQPGHSHADELNFELFANGFPVIVDTGVTTYERGIERETQRSTASHNCVTINGRNSSDVWSSFRVGKRAEVHVFEKPGEILVSRTDFTSNSRINRSFILRENQLILEDEIIGSSEDLAEGRLHFHPSFKVFAETDNSFRLVDSNGATHSLTLMEIIGAKLTDYSYSQGYNQTRKATKLEYTFKNSSRTKLTLNK